MLRCNGSALDRHPSGAEPERERSRHL